MRILIEYSNCANPCASCDLGEVLFDGFDFDSHNLSHFGEIYEGALILPSKDLIMQQTRIFRF